MLVLPTLCLSQLHCCTFPLPQTAIYHDLNATEPPETTFSCVDVSWPTPSRYAIIGKNHEKLVISDPRLLKHNPNSGL